MPKSVTNLNSRSLKFSKDADLDEQLIKIQDKIQQNSTKDYFLYQSTATNIESNRTYQNLEDSINKYTLNQTSVFIPILKDNSTESDKPLSFNNKPTSKDTGATLSQKSERQESTTNATFSFRDLILNKK